MRVAVHPPAGLLGRLESGPRGLLELAEAIVPDGTELLLIVDQFEETFTLTEAEDDRALFLESLRVATADPASRVRVIATLRADFYDRPLRYPRMGELMGSSTEVLGPLTPEELERAIVRPAEHAGLTVDRALVPQIAADVAEQPGALPLVQYALTELYDRRHEGRLTLEAYREIGGVGGALAASAEHLYASRQPAGREAVRQLFLRLVTPGEGAADTRRRVPLSELSAIEVDASAMESAIDTYGRHRLLTFDRDASTREPTVEVAHEALLGAWERLRRWIDEGREDLRMHRRLSDAANEWERSGPEPSFLLTGSRLDQFESWASTTTSRSASSERGYLAASVTRRETKSPPRRLRGERERTLERRSVKRLRALVAVLTAAVVVAGTLTAIILNRNASAQRASSLAAGHELLAAAAKNLDVDRQLAILLALEALRTTQGVDGTSSCRRAKSSSAAPPRPSPSTRPRSMGRGSERFGWFTPDGSAVALVGDDGSVGVWDLRNGSRILALRPSPNLVRRQHRLSRRLPRVDLSDDAHLMATGDGEGLAHVWDLDSGREVASASTHAPPQDLPAGSFAGADVSRSLPSVRTASARDRWGATARSGCGTSRRAHRCGPLADRRADPPFAALLSTAPPSVPTGPDCSSCADGRRLPASWTSPPGNDGLAWARGIVLGMRLRSAPTAPGSPSGDQRWIGARRGLGPAPAANEGGRSDRRDRAMSGWGAQSRGERSRRGRGSEQNVVLLLDGSRSPCWTRWITGPGWQVGSARRHTTRDRKPRRHRPSMERVDRGTHLHLAGRAERRRRSRVQPDGSRITVIYSDGRIIVHAIAFDDVIEIAKGSCHARVHGRRVPHVPPRLRLPGR